MNDLESAGNQEQADELRAWVYELAVELYENEEEYVKELYYDMGWEEDVNIFVRYNFNKALMNMVLTQSSQIQPQMLIQS